MEDFLKEIDETISFIGLTSEEMVEAFREKYPKEEATKIGIEGFRYIKALTIMAVSRTFDELEDEYFRED